MNQINLKPKRIAVFLGWVVFGLLLASICSQTYKFLFFSSYSEAIAHFFDLNREENLPSLYSSFSLLFSSLIIAFISLLEHKHKKLYKLHWQCLSLIFLYLSLDEALSFHELPTLLIRSTFNLSGILYYSWIVPAAILLFIFVIAYSKFILSLPPRSRYLFVLAGFIYVFGALGVESLGGWCANRLGRENLVYFFLVTVEELCEMTGILIFIYSLLDYINRYCESIVIKTNNLKNN